MSDVWPPIIAELHASGHAGTVARLYARDFAPDQRQKYAKSGVAMPDGSYPIPDRDALRRAINAYGRASNKAAVKRHIVKRARALGLTDMLPEGWLD